MGYLYRHLKTDDSGFTLIELMIVVAIVAILAAIAIPNYMGERYRVARTEAYTNIGALYSLEHAYSIENQTYITSAWVPSNIPGSTKSPWQTGSNFDKLGFAPKDRVFYRYGIGSGGGWVASPADGSTLETPKADIIIQAEGDVDGDGATGQFYTTDELRTVIPKTTNF